MFECTFKITNKFKIILIRRKYIFLFCDLLYKYYQYYYMFSKSAQYDICILQNASK